MHTITRTEWRNKHRDYKCIIEGQRYVLKLVEGQGTCLVPVTVVADPKGN